MVHLRIMISGKKKHFKISTITVYSNAAFIGDCQISKVTLKTPSQGIETCVSTKVSTVASMVNQN